jgi:hypothetical protein
MSKERLAPKMAPTSQCLQFFQSTKIDDKLYDDPLWRITPHFECLFGSQNILLKEVRKCFLYLLPGALFRLA